MRLLRQWHPDGGESAARCEQGSLGWRNPCRPRRQSLPLRHPRPHPARDQTRCCRIEEGVIMAQGNDPAVRKLPGSLDNNRRLHRWLQINKDGTVTVTPGKVEIGQGILTALVQIVAEELDISVHRIRLAPATTAFSPDEGITSGSRSIQESGLALRHAASEVRGLLLELAAKKLGVTLESLTVADGVISARGGGSVTYWELVTPDLLAREASFDAVAKLPAEHVVVGTSLQRVDILGKITGKASYVQDMVL